MEAKIKSDENNRNKNILWYVMTDSSDTREYIKRKFGDKVFSKYSLYDLYSISFFLRAYSTSLSVSVSATSTRRSYNFLSCYFAIAFLTAHNSTIQNMALGKLRNVKLVVLYHYFIS